MFPIDFPSLDSQPFFKENHRVKKKVKKKTMNRQICDNCFSFLLIATADFKLLYILVLVLVKKQLYFESAELHHCYAAQSENIDAYQDQALDPTILNNPPPPPCFK
jgi:hypothetical protein